MPSATPPEGTLRTQTSSYTASAGQVLRILRIRAALRNRRFYCGAPSQLDRKMKNTAPRMHRHAQK
jgi:hypothetical protein